MTSLSQYCWLNGYNWRVNDILESIGRLKHHLSPPLPLWIKETYKIRKDCIAINFNLSVTHSSVSCTYGFQRSWFGLLEITKLSIPPSRVSIERSICRCCVTALCYERFIVMTSLSWSNVCRISKSGYNIYLVDSCGLRIAMYKIKMVDIIIHATNVIPLL